MQGIRPHPLANLVRLDLGKFGSIWAKLRRNLDKIPAKLKEIRTNL